TAASCRTKINVALSAGPKQVTAVSSAGPLVSIVIPYFKQEEFLLEAVRSASAQTYRNFEIIVVDDCSEGRSAQEVLADCEVPAVRIIRHEYNQGPAAARNTAIRASLGALILPLDADDMITADYLAVTTRGFADDPDLGAVFTNARLFGDEDGLWCPQFSFASILCYGLPNSFLFKGDVFASIGGYNPALRLGENSDYWLRAQQFGWRFQHIDEPLYLYRRHSRAKTRSQDFLCERARALVREHKELFVDHLEEILLEQTARYVEQYDIYSDVYQRYEMLNSDIFRQYDELKHYHEHATANAHVEETSLIGRLVSMFRLKALPGRGM